MRRRCSRPDALGSAASTHPMICVDRLGPLVGVPERLDDDQPRIGQFSLGSAPGRRRSRPRSSSASAGIAKLSLRPIVTITTSGGGS
jgi:hypothetical protein